MKYFDIVNERGTGLKLCGTPFDRQSCDHFCDRHHLTSPDNGQQSVLLDDTYQSTIFPFYHRDTQFYYTIYAVRTVTDQTPEFTKV